MNGTLAHVYIEEDPRTDYWESIAGRDFKVKWYRGRLLLVDINGEGSNFLVGGDREFQKVAERVGLPDMSPFNWTINLMRDSVILP